MCTYLQPHGSSIGIEEQELNQIKQLVEDEEALKVICLIEY